MCGLQTSSHKAASSKLWTVILLREIASQARDKLLGITEEGKVFGFPSHPFLLALSSVSPQTDVHHESLSLVRVYAPKVVFKIIP